MILVADPSGSASTKLPRHRRDAGEPLQEIERDALAEQNRRCRPGKRRQRRARLDDVAVLHMEVDIHQKVDLREHLFEDRQTAHDDALAGVQRGRAERGGLDARFGGDVSTVDVFGQRATNGFRENGGSRRSGLHECVIANSAPESRNKDCSSRGARGLRRSRRAKLGSTRREAPGKRPRGVQGGARP